MAAFPRSRRSRLDRSDTRPVFGDTAQVVWDSRAVPAKATAKPPPNKARDGRAWRLLPRQLAGPTSLTRCNSPLECLARRSCQCSEHSLRTGRPEDRQVARGQTTWRPATPTRRQSLPERSSKWFFRMIKPKIPIMLKPYRAPASKSEQMAFGFRSAVGSTCSTISTISGSDWYGNGEGALRSGRCGKLETSSRKLLPKLGPRRHEKRLQLSNHNNQPLFEGQHAYCLSQNPFLWFVCPFEQRVSSFSSFSPFP